MPRRVQDIIPANRRTVRDIAIDRVPLSKKTPPKDFAEKIEEKEKISAHDQPVGIRRMPITLPPLPPHRRAMRFPLLATVIGVIIILAGLAFALSGYFARATFTIIPKSIPVQVNGTYVIPAMATSTIPLAYDVFTVTGTASTTVPATSAKNVETKASGAVTLYNAYSSQSQRLVAGTRLSGNSGLVYRLTSSIVMPGYTSSSDSSVGQPGSIVPGSTVATIIADQPGETYNISRSDSVSDLKIVAYKGTSKYAALYGRLSSDIVGGFSGMRSTVAAGTLASTTASLQTRLLAGLRDKMAHSIPVGRIMYQNTYTQSFATPSVISIGSTIADVAVTGTLYGITFKASDLATMLAGVSSTASFGSLPYDTPGLESLSFSIANIKDFSPAKKSSLVAKISGSFKLVGSVPVDTLKKDFAGISLAQTGAILKKYALAIDIKDSFGEIAPPWVSTVPSDLSRISIVIKNP